MTIRVRRVDISNEIVRAAIDTMIAECFSPDEWRGEQLPKATTGYWWVAFDGREPAAFACLRPSIRLDQTGYLSAAGVLEKWRGRGLQKRMIEKRVEHARALGWHTVITDTINHNVASMRSLITCGFRPFAPTVKWGDPYAVYWQRSTEPRLTH